MSAVEQGDDGVSVTTRDGETFTAKVVVVAVPLNVLGRIEFTPELSDLKRAAALEGQASRGAKIWIRIQGDFEKAYATAADSAPFSWIQSEYDLPDGQFLVGFSPDAENFDGNDLKQVRSAMREFFPESRGRGCLRSHLVSR